MTDTDRYTPPPEVSAHAQGVLDDINLMARATIDCFLAGGTDLRDTYSQEVTQEFLTASLRAILAGGQARERVMDSARRYTDRFLTEKNPT